MNLKATSIFTRYDLPLEYYLDHDVYKRFYEMLIPELSTIHHGDSESIEMEDIYNDAKYYIDRILTSKHPEIEYSKADKEIINTLYLHRRGLNLFYAYIVRQLVWAVVYILGEHTEGMRQMLAWSQDNIHYNSYYNNKSSLLKLVLYSLPTSESKFKSFSSKKNTFTLDSPFYELDNDYKDEAVAFCQVELKTAPMLTRIVEGMADTDEDKDGRMKASLPQDVVLEILKQMAMKSGYNPEESNNIDFARFSCMLTGYQVGSVSKKFTFKTDESFVKGNHQEAKDIANAKMRDLGISIVLD